MTRTLILVSSHLALPKDDKKRAIFKDMLKLASEAARNRAMMHEERGNYKECEYNIVEETIAEYLQRKVMTDGESSMNAHGCCKHFMKTLVTPSEYACDFIRVGVERGAAVFEGFQIMKSIASEVIKHKEHHEYFLKCMKKNPGTFIQYGPDDKFDKYNRYDSTSNLP